VEKSSVGVCLTDAGTCPQAGEWTKQRIVAMTDSTQAKELHMAHRIMEGSFQLYVT
jgi:hypothetical protein